MPVEILPAREEWTGEFDALAGRLSVALGPLALRIDHIGSTAVPGLAAKDVIDVQVVVGSLEPDAALAAGFASIGFEPRPGGGKLRDHIPASWTGDEAGWDKLLFGPPAGTRASNVHVRVAGSPNERYALLFRDFLRANGRARDVWGDFKRRLVEEVGGDRELYADLKDPATDVMIATAEVWARATAWPGPALP